MDYTNKFNPDILFPVMFTTTLGKINNFEMGVGETISLLVKANSSSFKKERILNFSTIINIGYRYYPKNQNVFFRVTYTPIIFQNKYYRNWAGLSVGYRF